MKKRINTIMLFGWAIMAGSMISCERNGHESNLRVSKLFSDHMVLQQNSTVSVWGWAEPGSAIGIESSWGTLGQAMANEGGQWSIDLKTPETDGKPQTIEISAPGTTIVVKDVLLGEVWVCSGQSNMEMPVGGWLPNDPILNSEQVIQEADYPGIRMFTVKRNKSFTPLDSLKGTWEVTTPENVPEFSAAAYFFGLELHKRLGIPVGLIHSSWSGSPAQSWVQEDHILKVDGFGDIADKMDKAADTTTAYNKWLASMQRKELDEFIESEAFSVVDEGFEDVMDLEYDDSQWDTVRRDDMDKVFQRDNFNGIAWFRQEFFIDSDEGLDAIEINLGKIEDLNTVFVNGSMIGRKEHWGGNDGDQRYDIPEGLLHEGKNVLAVRVIDVWERGGILDRPILIYGGEKKERELSENWTYLPTAILLNEYFYVLANGFEDRVVPSPDLLPLHSHTPTVLYNAMIAPLIPFTIKGAIWYQGESNIGKPEQYRSLFPAVFQSWREQWGLGDFPFYYVQLASFDYGSDKVAELREVQLETLSENNVGMAVAMDLGSLQTIHPPNKQDVGKRLALWALAKDYGKTDLVYSGPLYKEVAYVNGKAVLTFDMVGSGLYSPDRNLDHFEIAGEDEVFYPADAVIESNRVIVQSDKVSNPKFVRFAWDDSAIPNFFNREGLPASPFRTK